MTEKKQRSLAIAMGVILDYIYQEPPENLHPVVLFAKAQNKVEATVYKNAKTSGAIYLVSGVAISYMASYLQKELLSGIFKISNRYSHGIFDADNLSDFFSTTLGVAVSVGGSMLWEVAGNLHTLILQDNLAAAREELSSLVGRDTADLDYPEIIRAVIESIAENTVDAIIAPLFFAYFGGNKLSFIYRGVNTLDAMVGYKNERYLKFGFASAKCDDVLNYLPARLAACLVMMMDPKRSFGIYRAIKKYAGSHPSPNAGVIETAFAAYLNVGLGGTNYYNKIPEERPVMGDAKQAVAEDIARAIALSKAITAACVVFFALISYLP